MGKTLIDTNVVIDFLNRKLPRAGWKYISDELRKGVHLSAITKIELLGYKVEQHDEAILKSFISGSTLLPVVDEVIDKAIWVCKLGSIKTPDAIIAATALVYNLNFVS